MAHEFNHRVIEDVAHRPWPMPLAPWMMTQSWHDLLFAHWQIDPDRLAGRIPPPLQLDLFNGEAWIAIVPFRMEHVAPRGIPPLPWLSTFPEVNVRTYVRLGDKPGVFFFSLDATNPIAVRVARFVFHLPYYQAFIDLQAASDGEGGVARYESARADVRAPLGSADLIASYRPAGPVFHAASGTREHFLTERYCLYAADRQGRIHICEIHHAPWPLQCATARFEKNTLLDVLGLGHRTDRDLGRDLTGEPLLHFSKRQDTLAWRPTRIADAMTR